MHVAADTFAPLLASLGHTAIPLERLPSEEVDAVVLHGPDAWSRARAHRAAGLQAGIVICAEGASEPPLDRAAIEPVALLRAATGPGLASALASVAEGRPLARVHIAGGRLDLELRAFVPEPAGAPIALSQLHFCLLAYLAARAGRPVDRSELLEQVWGQRPGPTKTVDMAVARLRRLIEADPDSPTTLLTVRHGGYCIAAHPLPDAAPAVPSTPLVGREPLVRELVRRMSAGSGPLALVGAPGIGKSRLAAEVAHRLAAAGERVRWADLDAAPPEVHPAVALATLLDLDLPQTGPSWEALAAGLDGSILILDHGEQRPDIVEAIAGLAPALRSLLLATQIPPERPSFGILLLPPLSDEDALALLLDRTAGSVGEDEARRVLPHLDGLPLALILAAPQLVLLGAEGLCASLDARLALLSPGGAGRHGSLGEAVVEAVRRLTPERRRDLAALAVFEAPFRLADARAVLGDRAPIAVSELVGRGMIVRTEHRFRLLHAIRDHVASSADPPGERASIEAAHLAWAVERAVTLRQDVGGLRDREAHLGLSERIADLWAALDRALRLGAARDAACLAEGIDAVLSSSGTLAERLALVARLSPISERDPEARARVAWMRGRMSSNPEPERMRAAQAAARALAGSDPAAAARARLVAAHILLDHQPAEALSWMLETELPPPLRGRARAVIALCREGLGEQTIEQTADLLHVEMDDLVAHGAMFDAVYVGLHLSSRLLWLAPDRAGRLLRQLSSWCGLLRDPRLAGRVQSALADLLRREGRQTEARAMLVELDAAYARFDPRARRGIALALARVDLDAGALDAAREGLSRVIAHARAEEKRQTEVFAGVCLVMLELEAGRPDAARHAAHRVADASAEGNPHFRTAGHLAVTLVECIAGDPTRAAAAWREIDPGHLDGLDRALWLTAGIALGASELWTELEATVRERTGPDAASVREIAAAGRSGRRERIEAILAQPRPGETIEVRTLARLWLAVP